MEFEAECCKPFDPHAKSASLFVGFEAECCKPFDPHAKSASLFVGFEAERCKPFDPHAKSASLFVGFEAERCKPFDPHAKSSGHTACARHVERMELETGEEPAILQGIHVGKAMDAGFEARMANTFETADYLAKKERPFSDFSELVALQEDRLDNVCVPSQQQGSSKVSYQWHLIGPCLEI